MKANKSQPNVTLECQTDRVPLYDDKVTDQIANRAREGYKLATAVPSFDPLSHVPTQIGWLLVFYKG